MCEQQGHAVINKLLIHLDHCDHNTVRSDCVHKVYEQ